MLRLLPPRERVSFLPCTCRGIGLTESGGSATDPLGSLAFKRVYAFLPFLFGELLLPREQALPSLLEEERLSAPEDFIPPVTNIGFTFMSYLFHF